MTRSVTRPVIARDALGTLTKLGQGGQGIVYQAPKVKTKFADAMVYKEYKPQARAGVGFDALSAMPTLVEDALSDPDGRELLSIAAWPCALVENATGPVGFVMPAIPDSFYIDLTTVKGVSRTTAEFQHLLNPRSVLAARGITITDTQRYQLLREVAKALAFLHRIGVCVGDVSPKNLLFSLQLRPAVYFIDCDAMRVNGVSTLPQMETPEWEAPTGEELATAQSDTYKLALLALRLLAGDQHTKDVQQLPAATPKLIRQLITDTLINDPSRRPLAETWTYLLRDAIGNAQDRGPTSQTPATPPKPPTHVREPQPVVRSRPTATPSAGRPVAANVSAPAIPASASPPTSATVKNPWAIVAWATLAALVVGLLIALAITSNGGSSQSTHRVGSSTSGTTKTSRPTSGTPARPTAASTPQRAPTAAPAPPTSRSVSYGGLTCSSGAALWLRTAKSVVLICDQGAGTYVYKGLRLSDGATIQLRGVVRTAEGFSVTNEGWRYNVGLDGLVLRAPDGEVYPEPAVESGS